MKYETSGLVRTCSDLTLISSSVIYVCLIFFFGFAKNSGKTIGMECVIDGKNVRNSESKIF